MKEVRRWITGSHMFLVVNAGMWALFLGFRWFAGGARAPFTLMPQVAPYLDFTLILECFKYFHTSGFYTGSPIHFLYPAASALPYLLLRIAGGRIRTYLIAATITVLITAVLLVRLAPGKGWKAGLYVVCCCCLSYPLWFALHQANIEVFLWGLLVVGLYAFVHKRPTLAAVLFGFAAAMKLYPVAFFGLLFLRKEYRSIAIGLVAGAALLVFSAWLVDPNLGQSFRMMSAGLREFNDVYALHRLPGAEISDHSFFAALRTYVWKLSDARRLKVLLRVYLLCGGLVACALFIGKMRLMPFFNQVAFICAVIMFLTPVSFDYTLLHAYTPLAFLVTKQVTKPMLWITGILAAIASPLTEFATHINHAGLVRAGLLMCFLVLVTAFPVPSDDEACCSLPS